MKNYPQTFVNSNRTTASFVIVACTRSTAGSRRRWPVDNKHMLKDCKTIGMDSFVAAACCTFTVVDTFAVEGIACKETCLPPSAA